MPDDPLFLIAHKVRGAPAFDIAIQMTCPVCEGTNDQCTQCDGAHHWWIIPTSGHRAWPWWSIALDRLKTYHYNQDGQWTDRFDLKMPSMPTSLRDHYTTEREAARSLIDTLGLTKPATPPPPLLRRL